MTRRDLFLEIVVEIKGKGRKTFSHQKSVIVGSGPTANLVLEDSSVSPIHAILKASEDETVAFLGDLGSDEGTRINGKDLERETAVKTGDRIQVGKVEIAVLRIGPEIAAQKTTSLPGVRAPQPSVAKPKESRVSPIPRPPRPSPHSIPIREVGSECEPLVSKVKEVLPSGQNFFIRELKTVERPLKKGNLLEVKVMWGDVVLDARQFAPTQSVTIGDHSSADFRLMLTHLEGKSFCLISPGGPADSSGFVINLAPGMEIEVRENGKVKEIPNIASSSMERTYFLKVGEKCRILYGGVAFVIQYVTPARRILTGLREGADIELYRWLMICFILAVGMWFVIQFTPKAEAEVFEYLKNPARFAKLIMPTKAEEKKRFDDIKKKKIEEVKPTEDTSKWKKSASQSKVSEADVPREVKEERDRKIATDAGLLKLLKGTGGGGTGDNASSLFGGAALTNLDQNLDGLKSTGMVNTGGFGGLGTRGGGPGGGGGGLGLGGLGTSGYGRGDGGMGFGGVKIEQRGKHEVKVIKGKTKVIGSMSKEVVGRYLNRYLARIKYCYERELSKDPNLYGKVAVTFTIAGNGRVSEAQVMQTTLNNKGVEECILRVVRDVRFPAPKGGGQVIVTYPFVFTTSG